MSWIFGLTSASVLFDKALIQIEDFLPANHKSIKTNNHLIFFDDKVNLFFSETERFIVRGLGFTTKRRKILLDEPK